MSVRPVHAVVVAYHGSAQLSRCLGALARQVPVTVVDNSSSTFVATVANAAGAAYVDVGANRGFAAAVNIGMGTLTRAEADVLLINPDATVTPQTIDVLAQFLTRAENSRVAAVAPRLMGPNGEEQRVAWPFPSPLRMWAEAVGLNRTKARDEFVVGAVVLLRREAVVDVGLFDERFFLYAEETDWQRRAAARNWTSAVCHDAIAEHEGAGASSDLRRRQSLFYAAQETYITKWYGRAGWQLYRVAACLGAGLRTIMLTGDRRAEAARRMLLYLRGPGRAVAPGRD